MIHVVEKGAIVESGRHAELLRRSGRYAHFYRMRFNEQDERLADGTTG
jgi:ABC-type multidrug transport system fused ATPase/permease subunit